MRTSRAASPSAASSSCPSRGIVRFGVVILPELPWATGRGVWQRGEELAVRLAELVDLIDRLLREPEVTFEGAFYSADEARTYPGCVQQPRIPFAIAAAGPRGMQLAATYAQTWVTIGDRVRQKFLQA